MFCCYGLQDVDTDVGASILVLQKLQPHFKFLVVAAGALEGEI
jgi:hypothetical protein